MTGTQPPPGWQPNQPPYRPMPPQGSYPPYQQTPPNPSYGQQGPYPQGQFEQMPAGSPWGYPPMQEPKRRRKGLIAGGVGAALAVVVAGAGAYAYTALSGGGPQPAEALPSTSIAYARVDLDPSASQKINLIRLLRRIPDFSEQTGIDEDRDDLRRTLFEKATASSECKVDYEDDVKPWIGDRAAVAAVPVAGRPQPVFAIQTSDAGAAKDTLDELADCGGEAPGVRTVGDYLLIAEKQSIADEAARQTKDQALSDDKDFSRDMDTLGDQGIASFWVDEKAFTQLGGSSTQMSALQKQDLSSVAGAVRAGSDYIELAAVGGQKSAVTTDSRSDVPHLPASTVFAASVVDGGRYVDKAWSSISESAGSLVPGFDSDLAKFEDASGLSVPGDLKTLLGEDITVAVDGRGLGAVRELQDAGDLGQLGIGVAMTTDTDRAQAIFDRVSDKLSSAGDPALATRRSDDRFVVATSDDYAEELTKDGGLGGTDIFKKVVPDADNAVGIVYLDVDRATAAAKKAAGGDDADEIRSIEPIKAIGMSVSNGDDHYNRTTVRVSFD